MRNLILILCLIPSLAWAEDPIVPNPNLTPGIFLADATVDKICEKGYTASVRHVTEAQRNKVFSDYGIPRSGEYEVDHLISLELGGSNSNGNLWPQAYRGYWNARIKDILENRLHDLVCMGKIPLSEAQYAISHNWIESYCKYVPSVNCKGLIK